MDHHDAARNAVLARMAQRELDKTDLARLAGIDYSTAGDFLNGTRWPRLSTLARIDTALGWEPGTVAAIASGDERPNVSDQHHTGAMLLDVDPDAYSDLSPAELSEAMATATAVFLRTVREIRAARVTER